MRLEACKCLRNRSSNLSCAVLNLKVGPAACRSRLQREHLGIVSGATSIKVPLSSWIRRDVSFRKSKLSGVEVDRKRINRGRREEVQSSADAEQGVTAPVVSVKSRHAEMSWRPTLAPAVQEEFIKTMKDLNLPYPKMMDVALHAA